METPVLQSVEKATVPGTLWRIDPISSTVGFSVKHMMFATVHGRFGSVRGTIRFDGDRPWKAETEVEIDAASIDTGIVKRDDHLRSADFFDVATYPVITFRSTRVEASPPGSRSRWLVAGDLTIHGVTRPVTLDVVQNGAPTWRYADVIEFSATARINRKDFGMAFNLPVEGGGLVVSDEVRVAITVQAHRASS
jgi:polyisoprenoid-binding protein YceI